MRKNMIILLAVLLCVAFCSGTAAQLLKKTDETAANAAPGTQANAYTGFEILSQLHTEGGNTLVSPLSLNMALGMAAAGADGDTRNEILACLGKDAPTGDHPAGIESANAVFSAPGLSLKPEYTAQLDGEFGAEWFEIDEDVVERVNGWVSRNTNGMIDQLLTQAPDADTGLILINAVAMDAKWTIPFEPYSSFEESFHAPGGDVTVNMMHNEDDYLYNHSNGAQVICLPYAENGLEMWIILPEEGGMNDALDLLAKDGLAPYREGAKETKVQLSLPKFDLTDDHSMKEALVQLGMEAAFAEDADFSAMSDAPLYVDDVIQKVRVQVDEDGTRASAATAVIMPCMAMPVQQEPEYMEVNRPFLFAIIDGASGEVCFAGAVENPAA